MRVGVPGNIEEASDVFEPLPNGTYKVRVDDVQIADAKPEAKSDQVLKLRYVVVDGEHQNRSILETLGLSKDASFRLKGLLKATSTPFNVAPDNSNTDFDTDDLLNAMLEVDVTQRTYKNNAGDEVVGNRIKVYKPLS